MKKKKICRSGGHSIHPPIDHRVASLSLSIYLPGVRVDRPGVWSFALEPETFHSAGELGGLSCGG